MTNPDPDVRLDLLKIDHDNATRVIDATADGIRILRGWMITIWLALVGAAIELDNPILALLAALALGPFYLQDVYLSWVYGTALQHARRVERVWSRMYSSAGRGRTDSKVVVAAQAELEAHRPGLFLTFPVFNREVFRATRPSGHFVWIYVAMALLALGIALLCALADVGTNSGDPPAMKTTTT